MLATSIRHSQPPAPYMGQQALSSLAVQPLTAADEAEVMDFLAERPLHTVYLASLIRDNGLESPLNRGTFYAARNTAGELEGVALIGHATLFETRTESALTAFARAAQNCRHSHMLMAEQRKVEQFWQDYSTYGQPVRLVCRELLLEQCWPVAVREAVSGLRLATQADIELVMPIQAELAEAESGVNPLERDPEGFRRRCARRIEQGRVWVWVEAGRLIFKADIISETAEVTYLEGVWVHPEERGQGYALRCMAQLGRTLLQQTRALTLLVNEKNVAAQRLYRRAGFKLRACYDTIFLQDSNN
ncbi:MAG: GNAT family N-acetyltransferase [Pyrinomonadaceae bacterium]